MVHEKDYFGFIYKWTNTTNGKYYIGSHFGNINDGYIGSGVYFRRAYNKNPSIFSKEILEYVSENDPSILLEIEQRYLIEVCEIGNKNKCYNISKRAGGGYQLEGKTQEEIDEIYKQISFTLKEKTPEEREIINQKTRKTIESNPEKYKEAIERGKQTKKNWTQDKWDEIKSKMKETVDSNPEKKQAAIEARKQLILDMTPEERDIYVAPWRGKWSDERRLNHKEKLRIKKESKTEEELKNQTKNRSMAQKNRDPESVKKSQEKALKTLRERKNNVD